MAGIKQEMKRVYTEKRRQQDWSSSIAMIATVSIMCGIIAAAMWLSQVSDFRTMFSWYHYLFRALSGAPTGVEPPEHLRAGYNGE